MDPSTSREPKRPVPPGRVLKVAVEGDVVQAIIDSGLAESRPFDLQAGVLLRRALEREGYLKSQQRRARR